MSYLDGLLAHAGSGAVEPRVLAADAAPPLAGHDELIVIDTEVDAPAVRPPQGDRPPAAATSASDTPEVTPPRRPSTAPSQPAAPAVIDSPSSTTHHADEPTPRPPTPAPPRPVDVPQAQPGEPTDRSVTEPRPVERERLVVREETTVVPAPPPRPEPTPPASAVATESVTPIAPRPVGDVTDTSPGGERTDDDAPTGPDAAPAVNIRIGRIVVQPAVRAEPARRTEPPAAATRHRTLDDYLAGRGR